MQRHSVLFTSLIAAALVMGCARSSADRAPSTTPEPAPTAQPASASGRSATVTGVRVDPQLKTACGILEVQEFFELDSADVEPPQDTALYKLAECLSTGKLAGKKIRIIGHTDPRGSDHYNDELGKSRAQAVREYFIFHGLKHEAIETLSMGEAGADESSPAEWPYDRRVDIHLSPPAP